MSPAPNANYLFDVYPLVVQNIYVEEDVFGDKDVPDHFSTPEVLDILKDYHSTLYEIVEVKLYWHV